MKRFEVSNTDIANANGDQTRLEARGTGGAAFMQFHRPGAYAAYFGLDSDNVWKVGGWSMGANSYPILHSNNYNSYAPTLTGTGASGTWGISVTGNAANVTGVVAVANGGTGTATPSLVAGTNVTITGTWPNQTVNATASASFPSGTAMLFAQTAAPTGWTKSTTHDNKALRVVSGTASSGGTVAFTTAFASQAVAGTVSTTTSNTSPGGSFTGTTGGTSLTIAQMASHSHNTQIGAAANGNSGGNSIYSVFVSNGGQATNLIGSSTTHTHSFSGSITGTTHNHTASSTFTGTAIDLAVQYVDVIIATKD
jgi:hypothetical protein